MLEGNWPGGRFKGEHVPVIMQSINEAQLGGDFIIVKEERNDGVSGFSYVWLVDTNESAFCISSFCECLYILGGEVMAFFIPVDFECVVVQFLWLLVSTKIAFNITRFI